MDYQSVREEYNSSIGLLKDALNSNPLSELQQWFKTAVDKELPVANACTLATMDTNGFPQARVVLTKEINESGPVFFTSYESHKAKEIEHSNKVSLTFFWKEMDRQVRVWGTVEKVSLEESQAYFSSRPIESQISALAGPQSKITTKEELDTNVEALSKKYENSPIPAPSNWGGYQLTPCGYEFWQGRPSRLHDRFQFLLVDGSWELNRLAP